MPRETRLSYERSVEASDGESQPEHSAGKRAYGDRAGYGTSWEGGIHAGPGRNPFAAPGKETTQPHHQDHDPSGEDYHTPAIMEHSFKAETTSGNQEYDQWWGSKGEREELVDNALYGYSPFSRQEGEESSNSPEDQGHGEAASSHDTQAETSGWHGESEDEDASRAEIDLNDIFRKNRDDYEKDFPSLDDKLQEYARLSADKKPGCYKDGLREIIIKHDIDEIKIKNFKVENTYYKGLSRETRKRTNEALNELVNIKNKRLGKTPMAKAEGRMGGY